MAGLTMGGGEINLLISGGGSMGTRIVHVVVTGAGGLCGRHVTAHLLRAGWRVTAVAGRTARGDARPFPAAFPAAFPAGVDVLYGDLAGGFAFPPSFDAVVHAAARLPDPGVGVADLEHGNAAATRRVVEAAEAAGAGTVLYLSSLSVYGRIIGDVVDEQTSIDAPEPYGAGKLAGERLVRAGGFRSLALRLPGVIGPHSARNWLSRVMAAARIGEAVTVVNPDTPFNNAVHVDDLAAFIVHLLATRWSGADAVTLGAAGMTTALGAARALVEGFGSRSRILVGDAPDAPRFTVSSQRATASYGYAPMEIGAMLERFVVENAAD